MASGMPSAMIPSFCFAGFSCVEKMTFFTSALMPSSSSPGFASTWTFALTYFGVTSMPSLIHGSVSFVCRAAK